MKVVKKGKKKIIVITARLIVGGSARTPCIPRSSTCRCPVLD